MTEDYYAKRRALDRENAVRAEAEARALEAEAERMRKCLPRDSLAERRRLERENEAAAKLEAELEMEAMQRAAAAFRAKPAEPEAQKPPRPWVTSWRTE